MEDKRTSVRGWVVVAEWDHAEDLPLRLALETVDGDEVELVLGSSWDIGNHIDAFVEVDGILELDEDDALHMRVEDFRLVPHPDIEEEDDYDDDYEFYVDEA